MTTHVDSSGVAYVRTHLMDTAEEMAAAMSEYVGHSITAFWGCYRKRVTLVSIDGTNVRVRYPSGHEYEGCAWDAFATHCTMVYPLS